MVNTESLSKTQLLGHNLQWGCLNNPYPLDNIEIITKRELFSNFNELDLGSAGDTDV